MKFQTQKGQYFGISSPIQEVAGLRLGERTYAPNLKTPGHSHQEAYFCLILDGASRQTYGSKTRLRERMTTAFYPPHELQSEIFGSNGGRIFNVELNARWLGYFRDYSVIGDESSGFREGPLSWLMSKLYYEFRRMDHASSLVIEGLTLEIIAEASRQVTAVSANGLQQRWLEHAREILHEQFADNLTLASIARTVGVHPVYLASSFRKKYQCTVGNYRQRLRVEFACKELSKSHSSLAQIALAAGFANQAHFSRTFKRLTGTTPGRYRSDSRQP